MRRLPVYLLIDTSGSMKGEPIKAVNNGLVLLIRSLKQNPMLVENTYISIISFDRYVKEVLPLTEVDCLEEVPSLVTPASNPTHMGKALEFLIEKLDQDLIQNTKESAGDYKPLLFLITDGHPSDIGLYRTMAGKINVTEGHKTFGLVVACAAGPHARIEPLLLLTDRDHVCVLSDMDEDSFAEFFICVSQSIPVNKWVPLPHAPKDMVPGPVADPFAEQDPASDAGEGV